MILRRGGAHLLEMGGTRGLGFKDLKRERAAGRSVASWKGNGSCAFLRVSSQKIRQMETEARNGGGSK